MNTVVAATTPLNAWSVVLLAVFVAFASVRLIEWLARRRDLLDRPTWRSAHVTPTPRLGGVGIVAAVWAGTLLAPTSADSDARLTLLICASALALIGLVDDLRPLPPSIRLAAEVGTALAFAVTVAPTATVDLPGMALPLDGAVAIAVTALWIVAVVNAWNFIDGLDGLAAGVTVVAAVGVIAVSIGGSAALPAAVAGAAIGFLIWNRPRASIFMGDSGSLFLGFLIAGAWFVGSGSAPVPLVTTAIVIAPVLLDTGYTLIRRLLRGKNVMQAHHDHLYQVLARSGVSPWLIAIGYALAVGVSVVAARAYETADAVGQAGILVVYGAAFALFAAAVSLLPRWSRRRD